MLLRVGDLPDGLLSLFEMLTHNVALHGLLIHAYVLKENGCGFETLDVNQTLADDLQDLLHLRLVVLTGEVGSPDPVALKEIVIWLDLLRDVKVSVDGLGPTLLLLPELSLFHEVSAFHSALISSHVGELADHVRGVALGDSDGLGDLRSLLVHLDSRLWLPGLDEADFSLFEFLLFHQLFALLEKDLRDLGGLVHPGDLQGRVPVLLVLPHVNRFSGLSSLDEGFFRLPIPLLIL